MSGSLQLKDAPWDLLATLPTNYATYDAFTLGNTLLSRLQKRVDIVGHYYRDQIAKDALRDKKSTNLALLVREPGNKHDRNAVAVLIARPNVKGEKGYIYVHCGYLPRAQAEALTGIWPMSNGLPAVLESNFDNPGNSENPKLLISGRFRDYLSGLDGDWNRNYGPGSRIESALLSMPTGARPIPYAAPYPQPRHNQLPPWHPAYRGDR